VSDSDSGLDRQVLRRAQNGDRQAQAVLIEHHQDGVYRLAFRLTRGEPVAAEDLAQEGLLRALKSLPRFRGEAGFGTWLHRIVVNLHLNQTASLASRARRRTVSISPGSARDGEHPATVEVEDPGRGPADQVRHHEEIERLGRALDELEEDRRVVVVLRDLEGRSYQDIAEELEIPVGTVRSRLFRAREDLRELMRERRPSGEHV
jgi:RNA polymerase sigma-70 factor (ECF subfamily)